MALFHWQRNRQIRRYARRLYPKLRDLYGGGKFFTEAQIRRAASEARLSPRYIRFGYAMFLPEGDFERLHPEPNESYVASRAAVVSVLGYDPALQGVAAGWDFGSSSDAGGADGGGFDGGGVGGDGGGGGSE